MSRGKPLGNMVIELGLDSAAFSKNLKGASQAVRSATSEMKTNFAVVSQGGSKMDGLKAKQSGLTKVIEAQKREVAELTKAYEESHTSTGEATAKTADLARKANDAKARLASYEGQLKSVNNELNSTDEKTNKAKEAMSSFSTKIGSTIKNIGKIVAVGTAAAVAGIVAITKSAIDEGAKLEQSIGGIETLYKKSADSMIKNADNAFKTTGQSADEYMSTVTGFSASLIQGLGGDTDKASKIAHMAMVDMSDNANKMGTSQEDIQNAYQGFAKQNYTIKRNLMSVA